MGSLKRLANCWIAWLSRGGEEGWLADCRWPKRFCSCPRREAALLPAICWRSMAAEGGQREFTPFIWDMTLQDHAPTLEGRMQRPAASSQLAISPCLLLQVQLLFHYVSMFCYFLQINMAENKDNALSLVFTKRITEWLRMVGQERKTKMNCCSKWRWEWPKWPVSPLRCLFPSFVLLSLIAGLSSLIPLSFLIPTILSFLSLSPIHMRRCNFSSVSVHFCLPSPFGSRPHFISLNCPLLYSNE